MARLRGKMDEKFIDAVKRFPYLWNPYLPLYKCNETKEAAWEEIVKEVHYRDVKSAKTRWKQLRDCHRDALKRQKSKKSTNATAKIRQWKYQKAMEFLLPYMANREGETSYKEDIASPTHQEDSPHIIEHRESYYLEDFIPSAIINEDDSSRSSQHSNTPDNPYEIASTSGISTDSVTPSSKKRKSDELTTLLKKHMENQEHFQKERQELKEFLKPPKYDDIDHFFLSMAKTFKKLPDYIQVPLKRRLFNFISEAEESYVMSWYNQNVDYPSSSGANRNNTASRMESPQPEGVGYSSSCARSTSDVAGQVNLSNVQVEYDQPEPPDTHSEDQQTLNTSGNAETEPHSP